MVLITELPDLVQRSIFSNLTPREQLNAAKVCTKWAALMTASTHKVHSIALYIGLIASPQSFRGYNYYIFNTSGGFTIEDTEYVYQLTDANDQPIWPKNFSEENRLMMKFFDEGKVNQIRDIFPAVENLLVVLGNDFFLDDVLQLVEQWHDQLTSFSFFDLLHYPQEPAATARFYGAINSMSNLKKLSLNLFHMPFGELPIVGQLTELRFFTISLEAAAETLAQFTSTLTTYGEANESLAAIEFGTLDPWTPDKMRVFTTLPDNLRRRIARFQFTSPFAGQLWTMGSNAFRGLRRVQVDAGHTTIGRLFRGLAKLEQLIFLSLSVDFEFLEEDTDHNDPDRRLLPQMPTVRALELSLFMLSHLDLQALALPWTMANLQVINLTFRSMVRDKSMCTECRLFSIADFHANHARAVRCFRQIFAPIKAGCTKLKVFKHNQEDPLGTVEEILDEVDGGGGGLAGPGPAPGEVFV